MLAGQIVKSVVSTVPVISSENVTYIVPLSATMMLVTVGKPSPVRVLLVGPLIVLPAVSAIPPSAIARE